MQGYVGEIMNVGVYSMRINFQNPYFKHFRPNVRVNEEPRYVGFVRTTRKITFDEILFRSNVCLGLKMFLAEQNFG